MAPEYDLTTDSVRDIEFMFRWYLKNKDKTRELSEVHPVLPENAIVKSHIE